MTNAAALEVVEVAVDSAASAASDEAWVAVVAAVGECPAAEGHHQAAVPVEVSLPQVVHRRDLVPAAGVARAVHPFQVVRPQVAAAHQQHRKKLPKRSLCHLASMVEILGF